MKWEIFAASRPQNGHTQNEDDFLVGRGVYPVAAIADGAGAANSAARKALALFSKFHGDAEKTCPMDLLTAETWQKWVKLLDSSLLGGAQSTFCAFTFGAVEDSSGKRRDVAVGCAVGDSRLYLLNREGKLSIITDGAKKARLGSGSAEPFTFRIDPLLPGDILLLLSDGAYTPMPAPELQKTIVTAAVRHFSEVPQAVIARAAKYGGLADDSTCVAIRVR
jgi:serine/threonine protein phosphatase PrpC